MFEIWKDCELGKTYKVETCDTFSEACKKVESYEQRKAYEGWHLRIVALSPKEIRQKAENAIKNKNSIALGHMVYSENREVRDIALEVMVEKLFDL